MPFDDRDGFTDGNALAGPLAEVFAVDVTAAESRCANCGRTGPVAELRVYGRAPGFVARCAGCDHVILRLVRGRGIVQLDMRGMISLAVPVGD
ncbi:hypothetical protein HGB48_19465 [Actinomadura latina]|uniref:Uncharacterized protein n=1 Tax=Actinomadura latina TaxID=163603 RepID=A0A846YZC6_9ACTN|nr:hypothetical protein [Actinomadura latina]